MVVPDIRTEVSEGVYLVELKGAALDEPRAKDYTFVAASTSSPILLLSRYGHATHAALASLGAPHDFEPLRVFELHLQKEYGGFCRDQMQRIHDFRRENDNTPRIMYTRLAKFVKESGGVFAESQLVKVFLSNTDKRLLDLALPKIIMEFDGWQPPQRHLPLWSTMTVHFISILRFKGSQV